MACPSSGFKVGKCPEVFEVFLVILCRESKEAGRPRKVPTMGELVARPCRAWPPGAGGSADPDRAKPIPDKAIGAGRPGLGRPRGCSGSRGLGKRESEVVRDCLRGRSSNFDFVTSKGLPMNGHTVDCCS
mmetsp:Transcript_45009/g.55084  ORF Transcript_45009/g.55084 Transcript_45009/m.55084 type:complete len:130 (-) Transcript_45009:112-501(-)